MDSESWSWWAVVAYLLVGLVRAAVMWHRADTVEAFEQRTEAAVGPLPQSVAVFVHYVVMVFFAVGDVVAWPVMVVADYTGRSGR